VYNSSAAILLATQNDYLAASATAFSQLTDHNRQPINLSYEVIDKAARMADGTMRKYVVAKKRKISVSWQDLPSGTLGPYNSSSAGNSGYTMTVDGNRGGAWMKTFYEANLFKPVRVRIMHSKDVGPGLSASAYTASSFFPSPYITASGAQTKVGGYEEFWAFIDNFSYDVNKRYTLTDLVSISMSFTEI
jgi:hypothetical protein